MRGSGKSGKWVALKLEASLKAVGKCSLHESAPKKGMYVDLFRRNRLINASVNAWGY